MIHVCMQTTMLYEILTVVMRLVIPMNACRQPCIGTRLCVRVEIHVCLDGNTRPSLCCYNMLGLGPITCMVWVGSEERAQAFEGLIQAVEWRPAVVHRA